jgi:hypothetical protein
LLILYTTSWALKYLFHILTLILWCRIFFEKLTVTQFLKQ